MHSSTSSTALAELAPGALQLFDSAAGDHQVGLLLHSRAHMPI
jgi:hypothetical protein